MVENIDKCLECEKTDCNNCQKKTRKTNVEKVNKKNKKIDISYEEKYKHLIGQTFEYLTIKRLFYQENRKTSKYRVECECKCGKVKDYYIHDIINYKVFSCGCYLRKINMNFNKML